MIMEYMGKEVEQHMAAWEWLVWWTLVICSLGILYPLYRHRKKEIARTSKFYR
jgi:hypothetical protein